MITIFDAMLFYVGVMPLIGGLVGVFIINDNTNEHIDYYDTLVNKTSKLEKYYLLYSSILFLFWLCYYISFI